MQPPRLGRLHSSDLRLRLAAGYAGLSDLGSMAQEPPLSQRRLPAGVGAGLPARSWWGRAPAGTTTRTPTTRAVWVPRAIAVPVALVAGLAVEVEVVMAAVPTPVLAPARVPPLAGAPVIVGHRPGISLSNARRTQTSKSQTCGEGSRGCDSFDVLHLVLLPRKPGRPNISLTVFLVNRYDSAWY